MAVVLSDPMIRGLRPAIRVTVADALQPGLLLRISPGGKTRTWAIKYRTSAGVQRLYTIGSYPRPWPLKKARDEAARLLRLVDQGHDPQGEHLAERRRHGPATTPEGGGGPLTVAVVVEAYLTDLERRARPATIRNWGRALRARVIPAIGDLDPDQVKRSDVRALISGLSPATAYGTFNALRACWRWVQRQDWPGGREILTSPLAGVDAPPLPASTGRPLSADELRALLQALDVPGLEAYRDAFRLLLYTVGRLAMVTGMRRSELEAIDEGDDARARWTIPGSRMKGKRDHIVPLSAQALAVIRRRLQAAPGDLLFPGRRGRKEQPMQVRGEVVAKIKATAARALGRTMERWSPHSLRHSAATHMAEDLAVREEVVSRILAHSAGRGPSVTRIYDRSVLLEERRSALQAWADWLDKTASAGS